MALPRRQEPRAPASASGRPPAAPLTFGADYGLTIFSEPDDGTTVRIRLPALDEEAARRYRKEGEA